MKVFLNHLKIKSKHKKRTMKSIKIAFLSLALVAAGIISVKAQTADEIIQKHYAAIGGVDNWKKIQTIKLTGSINAGGSEIPVSITTLQGKGMRIEFTVNGMTGYTIITDKTGWNYAPFGGQTKPEVIPDEAIKQSQDGLDICGSLIDYQTKGNKVTYLGKDEVEGTECHKIKVVFPSGKEETEYIDATNFYRIQSKTKVTANGKEVEQTASYGNFQKLPEGIVYPMSIDNGNGAVAIKTVEVNKPLGENYFQPAETNQKK
jgi:hypothetical protein